METSLECPLCKGEIKITKTKEHIHMGGVDYYYQVQCEECGWCSTFTKSNIEVSSGTILDQEYNLIAGTGSATLETHYGEIE